jgi:hypothetical protein
MVGVMSLFVILSDPPVERSAGSYSVTQQRVLNEATGCWIGRGVTCFIAREDRTRDNQHMLGWIATGIVVVLVVLFVLFRLRRSGGPDSLGSVSERWLADERGASRNDPQ